MKSLVPPILVPFYYKARSKLRGGDSLFDGDDGLFKRLLNQASCYGEYGCGASTRWVLNNTAADVISVDTSRYWLEKTITAPHRDRLLIKHTDFGAVHSWGRPLDYNRRHSFADYTDFLWQQTSKPDVVLIDGRFRVCCFLTSLKYAAAGTAILFDDYIARPHYHIAEDYVARADTCGRQCLFIVPPKSAIDSAALDKDIIHFRHVME